MTNTKYIISLLAVVLFMANCKQLETTNGAIVTNASELHAAIENAQAGQDIIMSNGVWKDVQIKFYGIGTEDKPITLRAETPGKVMIEGTSDLKLGGEHLVVDGLHFTNGAAPSRSVIQFLINNDTLAHHSRVTNCVIKDFNKSQKNNQDFWVLFKGRHNQLDHCYLAGKSNKGPTIRVDVAGNQSINNYHKINHNHFGRRPPKGGPSAETIQIGDSFTSMSPSYTMVSDNLFDRCDGEVEVISSKTNFNEFKNNVFYKSEGSLVTRHGNYCTVDGNYFIGDEASANPGGIRLIGTGHWVINNYFYNLKGEIFRAPLAVMNGIKKSPLNRYIQVTDVVVAHNTWVDCISPLQFGVGSNIDQKDVLPASELRSETPIRTLIANNVIHNTKGDPMPIYRHDAIDGIEFKNNVINNQNVDFEGVKGLDRSDFSMTEIEEHIWIPPSSISDFEVHAGFDFEKITNDVFRNSRKDKNAIGATNGSTINKLNLMDYDKYGPDWYDPNPAQTESKSYTANNVQELVNHLKSADDGDAIELTAKSLELQSSLKINKNITIQSAPSVEKTTISYKGPAGTPAFEMHPNGQLTLTSVALEGTGNNMAFASLTENMSSLYNLKVENCEISNFDHLLKAYKNSFSEYIEFKSTSIRDCKNGISLSSEDDDRGEYNVENLFIEDCKFERVHKSVINYYRGGYDESTVGGNLIIKGSTFTQSGKNEANSILINNYGIINVDISNNKFENNPVKMIARLWLSLIHISEPTRPY